MPGHRLTHQQRAAIRRGATIRLHRGWRRPAEPERPPASCVTLDPVTMQPVGLIERHDVEVGPARLKLQRCGRPKVRIERC